MLFMVIQEPKLKWRRDLVVNLQFVEADSKANATRQATRMQDTHFKSPYSVPVHVGMVICV